MKERRVDDIRAYCALLRAYVLSHDNELKDQRITREELLGLAYAHEPFVSEDLNQYADALIRAFVLGKEGKLQVKAKEPAAV
jgi:hypothetical protein